ARRGLIASGGDWLSPGGRCGGTLLNKNASTVRPTSYAGEQTMATTVERPTTTSASTTSAPTRSQIPVIRTPLEILKAKPADDKLGFGVVFTDHVFMQEYDEGQGWHDPRIEPYRALSLDPAAAVLHYAQAVFDGLKAFRGQDG